MPIPYFELENKKEIWDDITRFKKDHPQGNLAVVTLKDFNWYYNQWGPQQADKALEGVVGIFKQNSSNMEWFAYRNYGRWLVGFYQPGSEEQIKEKINQIQIESQGLEPITQELKKSNRTIELDPAKVTAEVTPVKIDSIDKLFEK